METETWENVQQPKIVIKNCIWMRNKIQPRLFKERNYFIEKGILHEGNGPGACPASSPYLKRHIRQRVKQC